MLPFASHAAASRNGQLVCAEPSQRADNRLKGDNSPEGCEAECCGSTGGGPAGAEAPLAPAPKLPRAAAGVAAAEAPPDLAAAGIGCAAAAAGAAAADAPGVGCGAAAEPPLLPPLPRTRTVSDSPLRSGSAATVAPSPRPSSCRGTGSSGGLHAMALRLAFPCKYSSAVEDS